MCAYIYEHTCTDMRGHVYMYMFTRIYSEIKVKNHVLNRDGFEGDYNKRG